MTDDPNNSSSQPFSGRDRLYLGLPGVALVSLA